jgi:hypothetical protein
MGLFTYYTFTFDLAARIIGVDNVPMSPLEPNALVTVVFDSNALGQYVVGR